MRVATEEFFSVMHSCCCLTGLGLGLGLNNSNSNIYWSCNHNDAVERLHITTIVNRNTKPVHCGLGLSLGLNILVLFPSLV